ncbi:tropomyosin-2-like [Nicotiana sylvestris]|uniref:tropomyosin-2-like n=1 Tax=Nicotiana sylvestris TaxID=4096 RepID=UPI00388CBAA6
MEKKYQAEIHALKEKLRNMKFNNDLQAQEAEGERRKLAQENEALRAQVRKMRIEIENPGRSRKDEKLIYNLTQKVRDLEDDLQKIEAELADARAKLAKNAEGWASFVRQLKEKYDKGMVSIKKKLEKDLQQLQEKSHAAEQVLDARSQQIGQLLQEKGIIRERVRRIADYIVMKCNECEDMTRSMFFASVMFFVQQIKDELFRLQEDMAQRPASRPTRAAVEALMYS